MLHLIPFGQRNDRERLLSGRLTSGQIGELGQNFVQLKGLDIFGFDHVDTPVYSRQLDVYRRYYILPDQS